MHTTLRTLLPLLLIVMVMGLPASAAGSENTDHIITTSSIGEVKSSPDRAEVSFTVETEGKDVKQAQSDNSLKMNEAIDALIKAGIAKDDIKTTGYNIYPVYDDSGGVFSNKVKVYHVTNTATVTIRDLSTTGAVIDTAVTAGVNQVNAISFMFSEDREQALRLEAIRKAVTRTRMDADAAATAAAVNITGIKEIQVSSGYSPVYRTNLADMVQGATGKSVAPTPINPGDVTVSVQVTVTYLIG